jgi:hypothetical protein
MIRNDYRRALILLRSAIRGMSGHVRLERRTLGGSMRFSVSGAGASDTLRAVLMRRGKGGWTAVPWVRCTWTPGAGGPDLDI